MLLFFFNWRIVGSILKWDSNIIVCRYHVIVGYKKPSKFLRNIIKRFAIVFFKIFTCFSASRSYFYFNFIIIFFDNKQYVFVYWDCRINAFSIQLTNYFNLMRNWWSGSWSPLWWFLYPPKRLRSQFWIHKHIVKICQLITI